MKATDMPAPINQFSYKIDFRYKKLDNDLKSTDFIKSTLTVTVDEAVPEYLQRNWVSVVRELNPGYFQIEIVNVRFVSRFN